MYKGKKILAIVPARLGSKRLKQKNIIKVTTKKNLLNWTFDSIKKSIYLDHTILSTESNKIKNIAKKIGFEVPFMRPKNLAKDNVDSEEVIKHILSKVKIEYDYIMLLQPTSPLRNSKDIDGSIKKIVDSDFNSLISISASKFKKKFNVEIIKKKFLKFKFDLTKKKKKYFFLNGAIFLAKRNFILKFSKPYLWQKKNKATFFLIPESRSIDIDTKKDFVKFKKKIRNK